MKNLFSLSFFLLVFTNLYSQEKVIGKVVFEDSGVSYPIGGSSIYWQGTQSGTISNDNGEFEIQKIVVSGIFEKYSREEIKKYVRMHGGTIQAGVSSNTNFLLAGNSLGPSKLEKAKKFGVKIVSEEQLINMLDG